MELKIIDVNYFPPNGKTRLRITGGNPKFLVKSGCFELVINEEVKETIWIEGQALINRKDYSKPYPRVITTRDSSIRKYKFEKDKWKLISVAESKCGK